MSLIADLHGHITCTDDTYVHFLNQRGVLIEQKFCEKINKRINQRNSDEQLVKSKHIRCQTSYQIYKSIR